MNYERAALCFLGLLLILSVPTAGRAMNLDVDLTLIDRSVDPCDDFYQYACGGWLAKTEIPADRPQWNRSFSTIDENNKHVLKRILEGYALGKKTPANPYSALLGDFYASCMDEKGIEKNSILELKEQIRSIDGLNSLKELPALLARLHLAGMSGFFDFGEEQDAKNSSLVIGVVDQGGLGLPDRDYYLKDDAKMASVRKLYQDYIIRLFTLLGDTQNAKLAPLVVMQVETALAKNSLSRVDRRDPRKIYHRLERQGLKEAAPAFDWDLYLVSLGVESTSSLQAINVAVPDFVKGLNSIFKETSLSDLKLYLKWHLISALTEALPKSFSEARFDFVSKALSGQKQIEARWKRCVRATDSEMGFALGRSFVEEAYGKGGKAKSQAMIREIEASFDETLNSLSWMDESTKKEAVRKLSKIKNKIGYPDVWRSYEGLSAHRKSFLKSLADASVFNSKYDLGKIGKPVDPNEWHMTPPMVNAYYSASRNEIVFPAGILQYPFFNLNSPDPLNYGAIGVVMGHELTHGFDDQGRQFDADGNLANWWDPSVLKKFAEKTACVENEYSSFEALPGVHLNGKLTLGENIADQGGMKLSHSAWSKKQKAEQNSSRVKGAVTSEQKFFLGFAQSWCQKEHEELTRMRVTTDPHSPARYRVNGVVSQFAPFSKSFGCALGTKMAPAQRCEVW